MGQKEPSPGQPTPSRELCQIHLSMAEARTDGAARAESSLLDLCRVVTEEGYAKEVAKQSKRSERHPGFTDPPITAPYRGKWKHWAS